MTIRIAAKKKKKVSLPKKTRPHISSEHVLKLKNLFCYLDDDNDGKLCAVELKAFLESIGHNVSDFINAEQVLQGVGTNGDFLVDFQDILRFVVSEEAKDEQLKSAFEEFEHEKGSGRITPHSLQKALGGSYGQCVSMIQALDRDGDGELHYQDFCLMMLGTTIDPQWHSLPNWKLKMEDSSNLLRFLRADRVKSKLTRVDRLSISYEEFVQICSEECFTADEGREVADALRESGTVFAFGNTVFLRPEQIVSAVKRLMPMLLSNPDDPKIKEIEGMENIKARIDEAAKEQVQREMCYVLVYFVIQTVVFIWLTFWKLSWNVMEPICFYMTLVYWMSRAVFFIVTSKEPTFTGLYQARVSAKQKHLMKIHKFDLQRYNELRDACYPRFQPSPETNVALPSDKGKKQKLESRKSK